MRRFALALLASAALAGCGGSTSGGAYARLPAAYGALDARCTEDVSTIVSEFRWAAKQTGEQPDTVASYIAEVMKDQNRTGVSCGAYVEAYVIMRGQQ